MSEAPAIGIDLGTTYSCVSVFQHGKVEIIANDQGNRLTPCYVAFTDEEILLGEAARDQVLTNPSNTIFDMKRLIGRDYNNIKVQTNWRFWPFIVVNDRGKPKIKISHDGETRKFSPEEVLSMVLKKMKQTAEAYLGKTVTDAVITVPANCSISQRQATKDAAVIAGLNVLRLINEPTAAAIAYGLDKQYAKEGHMVIFDIGGGTFEASLLSIQDGIFEVVRTVGDIHFGGEDFDNKMVDYFVEDIIMRYGEDLTIRTPENNKARRRLRIACERAKRTLSSSTKARIEIDSLIDGIDFNVDITREKFEKICENLFLRISEMVEMFISTIPSVSCVNNYILVGGCSRIPRIQEFLQNRISRYDLEVNTSINRDEVVAYGAAVQAAILHGDKSEILQGLSVVDVIGLPLGIETAGGVMLPVIEKDKKIPMKETKTYTTFSDNQPDALIHVYDGRRAMTIDNNIVGKFELTGIPLSPRGVPQIEVTFNIDASGLLNISAIEKSTGKEHKITVRNQERPSEEDIKRMINKVERYHKKDQERDRVVAKNSLTSYCLNMKSTMEDEKIKDKIDSSDKLEVINKCNEVISWLYVNQSAEKEKFAEKQKELEAICNPIIILLRS